MFKSLILIVLGLEMVMGGIGRTQSVAAKGQLRCKGEVASGIVSLT
jgi:hypothetical protein